MENLVAAGGKLMGMFLVGERWCGKFWHWAGSLWPDWGKAVWKTWLLEGWKLVEKFLVGVSSYKLVWKTWLLAWKVCWKKFLLGEMWCGNLVVVCGKLVENVPGWSKVVWKLGCWW